MVPLPFEMWVGEHDGVLMVRFAGRFEAPCADEVRKELFRHGPPALRVDLSGVTAVDSQGLAALVAIRHDVVAGGGSVLVHGATDAIRETLAVAGLDALVREETVGDEPEGNGPAGGTAVRPVTRLGPKGGQHARRIPATAPKVA